MTPTTKTLRLPPSPEERFQQSSGPIGTGGLGDGDGFVVAGRLFEKAWPMPDAAAFGIGGGEIECTEPGKSDGGSTHGARLQRDHQACVGQAWAAERGASSADRQQLSVGGGVGAGFDLIAGSGEHRAGGKIVDNRAHRHLAACRRRFRLSKGTLHQGGAINRTRCS